MRLFRKKSKGVDVSNDVFHDVSHEGRAFTFLVTHPEDHIQRFHKSGHFYEIEELERIRAHLGGRSLRIADVGANVGNHTVFMAHFLDCSLILPFEPNPRIIRTLKCNLGLNMHSAYDFRFLGLGLSDTQAAATIPTTDARNTGASYVEVSSLGSIPLIPGDHVCLPAGVNFIKIDVEGHELNVLKGLTETLSRLRPSVYVETRADAVQAVPSYMKMRGYRPIYDYCHYAGVINFMFEPTEKE